MIHSTAIVADGAELDPDCSVGPYAVIGANVKIGPGTKVGPHTVINGPTIIGAHNRIFQFASVGEDPQDLKYDGEDSRLEIGDHNTIREFVTINRGTTGGGGVTRLGDRNLLMAYVHIAHDCLIGSDTIFANAASLAGHVSVGDFAILGGFSLVHQFSRIGDHSFSGMGSVINKDVPPYLLVSGHYVEAKGVNKQGLKRRGFSPEAIAAIHKTYLKMVKKKGVKNDDDGELSRLADEHESVGNMLAFIRESTRGNVS